MGKFNSVYLTWRRRILTRRFSKSLDLTNVSLLSMNCIGGVVYHDLQKKFLSPTVNLFFTPTDFIKFVTYLDDYLDLTPVIEMGKDYPIGTLGDIKIYFMHYQNPHEALEKWEERKKRINRDKIFVIMVERDGFTKENFKDFLKIQYPKLLFTKTKEFECENSLYISKFKKLDQLPDIIPGRYMYDKMKLAKAIKKAYG